MKTRSEIAAFCGTAIVLVCMIQVADAKSISPSAPYVDVTDMIDAQPTGLTRTDLRTLTDEQIDKYCKKYHVGKKKCNKFKEQAKKHQKQ